MATYPLADIPRHLPRRRYGVEHRTTKKIGSRHISFLSGKGKILCGTLPISAYETQGIHANTNRQITLPNNPLREKMFSLYVSILMNPSNNKQSRQTRS